MGSRDLRCAKTLSPTIVRRTMVGRGGLEPPTSRLSGVRSNHLSYRPSVVRYANCASPWQALSKKDAEKGQLQACYFGCFRQPCPSRDPCCAKTLSGFRVFASKHALLKRYEDGSVRVTSIRCNRIWTALFAVLLSVPRTSMRYRFAT